MERIGEGVIWYVVFLFSTTFHEAAHSFVSMKLGDLTAYNAGQVTLSPFPHIKREPIGTVVVPILSFLIGGWMIGWASAPYNAQWAYEYPKRSGAMAAAGPMSNFILMIISALLIHIGIFTGLFYQPETVDISSVVAAVDPSFNAVGTIVSVFFSLNLILFVFNLLPVPPLDGSGIIPMFLNESSGRKYVETVSNSAFAFIGIFIAWKIFDVIYFKLYLVFINILYPGSNYQ